MNNTILALGGDKRLFYAAETLTGYGYDIIYSGDKADHNIIKESGILLLGVPVSKDGVTLYAPLCNERISLKALSEAAGKDKTVIGGGIAGGVFDCITVDYLKRDDFAYLNAVPTAEGVIETAMKITPYCISQSRCLVIGYGRIGKVICDRLSKLGAKVTASARKSADLALAQALGHSALKTSAIAERIGEFDIIINTVPSMILTEDTLKRIMPDSTVIDTASLPGGVDEKAALSLSVKFIRALGLPGKVAPETAGRIIGSTAHNIIEELGE